MRGKFITLEGIDGAGKSTHLNWLADWARAQGHQVVVTREPGGTPLGEMLRDMLLGQHMHMETETLLMFAARREHIDKVIVPAMEQGHWVISDRFSDASFAYQGGGRGIARDKLETLETWVQNGLQPDLTLLFDVPLEVSRARLSLNLSLDRFEQEKQDFFERVRAAYLERAQAYPQRIRVVDSTRAIADIRSELEMLLAGLA
jgi:dTMP kinase